MFIYLGFLGPPQKTTVSVGVAPVDYRDLWGLKQLFTSLVEGRIFTNSTCNLSDQ